MHLLAKRSRALGISVAVGAAMCGGSWLRGADYLLDVNYTGTEGAPQGGYTAVYNTITDALGATGVPQGASASNINRLYIAPGTYNTASTTGVSLQYSKSNVALIGTTGNPNDVIITSTLDSSYNPGSGALGTTGSATIQLKGNNVSAFNITFANSTDTAYIASTGKQAVSPTGNYVTGQSQTSNSPAVALLVQGDQDAFQNVKVMGYQDSLYLKGGRNYFKNSTVSGDIDFIFANATAVFNNATINMDGDHSGGTITAASTDKRTSNGLVFLNSTLTSNSVHGSIIDSQNAANVNGAAANSMSLGRPWGWQQAGGDASTVFINTTMNSSIKPAGWLAWNADETANAAADPNNPGRNGNDPSEDSRYAEFNSMNADSTPMTITARVAWSHQLSAAQAAQYTVANIFSDEAHFAWFGAGYPTGDNAPGSGLGDINPSFSNPAFWGPRNLLNDGLTSSISTVTGNPTSYSNPTWTLDSGGAAGTWDADGQLAAVGVPEPGTITLAGAGLAMLLRRRRRAC